MNIDRKFKFQISISIVIFILVFAITWQIKGVRKTTVVEKQISGRIETLQQDYMTELDKNEKLLQQIVELQNDVSKYREEIKNNGGKSAILLEELKRAEMIAGLTDVAGSGVILTIKDGSNAAVGNVTYDDGYGIVHDSYILMVLNELRASGAEALSLNGERILSTSEIRCAGPTISINNRKQAAPFEIKAIGNPDTLENAIRMPYGVIDQSHFMGIEVTVKKSNNMTIKKYVGSSTFSYATPIETEEIE